MTRLQSAIVGITIDSGCTKKVKEYKYIFKAKQGKLHMLF